MIGTNDPISCLSFAAPYEEKPWLELHDSNKLSMISPGYHDALAMFSGAAARNPDGPAICYFDAVLSYGEVNAQSDALAVALIEGGFEAGDRFGIYLQNVPQFVVAVLAAWKAGVIGVPDDYRGESVKAVISLKPGAVVPPEEIIGFCKERMAAYK